MWPTVPWVNLGCCDGIPTIESRLLENSWIQIRYRQCDTVRGQQIQTVLMHHTMIGMIGPRWDSIAAPYSQIRRLRQDRIQRRQSTALLTSGREKISLLMWRKKSSCPWKPRNLLNWLQERLGWFWLVLGKCFQTEDQQGSSISRLPLGNLCCNKVELIDLKAERSPAPLSSGNQVIAAPDQGFLQLSKHCHHQCSPSWIERIWKCCIICSFIEVKLLTLQT